MTRTVESIVASHQAASKLRAAGKPIWTYEVKVKDLLLDKDFSPEKVAKIANTVGRRLRAAVPTMLDMRNDNYNSDMEELVEWMEECTAEFLVSGDVSPEDQFDDWLGQLYDLADSERIWIG